MAKPPISKCLYKGGYNWLLSNFISIEITSGSYLTIAEDWDLLIFRTFGVYHLSENLFPEELLS